MQTSSHVLSPSALVVSVNDTSAIFNTSFACLTITSHYFRQQQAFNRPLHSLLAVKVLPHFAFEHHMSDHYNSLSGEHRYAATPLLYGVESVLLLSFASLQCASIHALLLLHLL